MSEESLPEYDGLLSCIKTFDASQCYRCIIKETMAGLLLIPLIYQFIKHFQCFNPKVKRKQVLLTLIFLSDLCCFLGELDKEIIYLYFLQAYFQYLYFCYMMYYFSRKALQGRDIGTIGLYSFIVGAVLISSVLLACNIYSYYNHQFKMPCKSQLFNLTKISTFFVQLAFFLIVYRLQTKLDVTMKEHLSYNIQESNSFEMKLTFDKTKLFLKRLWILTILCLSGQGIIFAQDLYFLIENKISNNFQCNILDSPQRLTLILANLADIVVTIYTFFLPYYLTVLLFWKHEKIESQTGSLLETSEITTYYKGLTYQPFSRKSAKLEESEML